MKNKTKLIRAVPALLTGLAILLLVACGNVGGTDSSGSGGGSGPTITVGSKNFTEQYILGNMYVQALAANGFNAVAKLDLGSEQIADKALQNGQIDLYPEYTGTSLVSLLPYKGAYPDTPEATYKAAKKLYATRDPADAFRMPDKGRITAGARADLMLVDGNPVMDITATRAIVHVFKNGFAVSRSLPEAPAPAK